jgi:hypothetical protein
MIKGYFHVALMYGGKLIAAEMHGRIIQSGLYDASDEINVVILGPKEQAKELQDYIFNHHSKYKVRYCSENLKEYEWPTLKLIQDDAKSGDHLVWYVHTKGASNCWPGVFPEYIQKNIHAWRGVMCHYMMNYKNEIIDELSKGPTEVIGVFHSNRVWNRSTYEGGEDHTKNYFVGNFWWTTAAYIRKLQPLVPPFTDPRNNAEIWISTDTNTFKSLYQCEDFDLYDFSNNRFPNGPLHGVLGSGI